MPNSLQIKFDAETATVYDGTQLSPHWIYKTYGLEGNALVSWIGEANVPLDHMVDLEDVKKKAAIYSPKMLHFLGEWFIDSLDQGILYQHYFATLVSERLLQLGVKNLTRRGNDIYINKKLNVSIATKSAVSVLVHFGINVETAGTPVPACGLSELSIHPKTLAEGLLETFQRDFACWQKARVKVSPR